MSDIAVALTGSIPRDGSGGMLADLPMGGHKITGAAPGTDPTDVATVSQLSSGGGVPAGAIMDYAGATAPSGWLICAGQSVNRADYPDLFAAIGTTFGSTSGATFNLPDCRGRVSAGVDANVGGLANRLTAMSPAATTIGATGGAQSVALTVSQLAAHTHTGSTASAGAHIHEIDAGGSINVGFGGAQSAASDFGGSTSIAGAHTHTMNLDNTGNGDAHPNVQPTILFNKIIKATANG